MPESDRHLSRRQLLAHGVDGLSLLGALSMGGLFGPRALGRVESSSPFEVRPPHFTARAKRCIFLFMFGGPPHMDLFDFKPELQKRDGRSVDLEVRRNVVKSCDLLASRRTFDRYGETGQWCSDALPNLAKHMDRLAVIKSLHTDSFAHGSAVLQMNSGQFQMGHPALGAWLNYGLGSECGDLPGFVVMQDPRGGPISGAANWTSGYMPAAYQGTLFRALGEPLLDLTAATDNVRSAMNTEMQREQLAALNALNEIHRESRARDSTLAARIGAYDLARRMQDAAATALDVGQEPESVRAMYGLDHPKPEHPIALGPAPFGRQCLIARRLIERGVRFVQIYHGGGHQQQTWDSHYGVEENLAIHCPEVDQPIAALLTDLDRSGLLDETLVIWGGEFGRQPVSQRAVADQVDQIGGRDHNPKAMVMWLAGAGVKPGSHGETDELGREAAVDRHHLRDLHATILHLMGLDWRRLTYPYGGLDRKLTGVIEPELIHGILA